MAGVVHDQGFMVKLMNLHTLKAICNEKFQMIGLVIIRKVRQAVK